MRPDNDLYFMNIAKDVALRSTCKRHMIGAVITKDNYMISTGYNGAPKGMTHCLEIGCIRNDLQIPSGERQEICRAVHAEQNAIVNLKSPGDTIYCTMQPCITCAKLIINAGIKRVVYLEEYADKLGVGFLKEAGVEVCHYIMSTIDEPRGNVCSVDGCSKKHHAKGFCNNHYRQYKKGVL